MSELAVNSPKVNLPTIKNITYQENRELCRSSAVVELKFQLAVKFKLWSICSRSKKSLTWKTVSNAAVIELKLEVGVPSGKLKKPPKSCIPSRAKINMNRKSRNNSDKIEDMAFIRAITRFLSEDQYLKWKEGHLYFVGMYLCEFYKKYFFKGYSY